MIVLKHTTITLAVEDIHISFIKNNTAYDFYIPEEEFQQIIEEHYTPRTL